MNKRDLKAVPEEVRNLRSKWRQSTSRRTRSTWASSIQPRRRRGRKGCNYCLKTNPEYAGYSDIWHDNKLSIGYGNYIEINFCPMCGRYLKG